MKGILMLLRYQSATIFVDHFSRLSYVRLLQSSLSSENIVSAKQAFEMYSSTYGVMVKHYHADNGRFTDNLFMKAIDDQGQSIAFCGVNAHFQDGIAVKRVRNLQDLTRTVMLHASGKWPRAFSSHVWPYALRCVNEALISAPRGTDGKSADDLFADTIVLLRSSAFHPFGCLVYVLHNKLQAGMKISKWASLSRLGMYLGPSPRHAKSVALVLNW
jgi:hypothetical protein